MVWYGMVWYGMVWCGGAEHFFCLEIFYIGVREIDFNYTGKIKIEKEK